MIKQTHNSSFSATANCVLQKFKTTLYLYVDERKLWLQKTPCCQESNLYILGCPKLKYNEPWLVCRYTFKGRELNLLINMNCFRCFYSLLVSMHVYLI